MSRIDEPSGASGLGTHLAAMCRQQAELVALGWDGERWDYRRLAERAAHIAAQLMERGLGPGDRVGLYLERSAELLATMLGCIRAGICFVPLAPDLPLPRLQALIRRLDVQLIVMSVPTRGVFPVPVHGLRPGGRDDLPWPELHHRLPVCVLPGAGAGRGDVSLTRRALASYLHRVTERMEACAGSRWLAVTALTEVAGLLEWLGPLWVGGYVEIVSSDLRDKPVELAALLRRRPDLNTLQGSPGFWRRLLKAGWRGHRGLVALCSGTGPDLALATHLQDCVGQLWNCYGTTATVGWSMMRRVSFPLAERSLHLGQSLDGYRHWVLDAEGGDVAVGGVGELCIECDEPALVRDAGAPVQWCGRQVRRTGIRVRKQGWDGFHYLGPLEKPNRLCGFRIELGDLESGLRQLAARMHQQGAGAGACLVDYVEVAAEGGARGLAPRGRQ